MAFWGVEVKPGKPFSHLPHSTGGRLHVSQATLGFGTATKKSVVQCNVGNKSPVFLCSLFPEQSESCQLNVEFEEVDEVVFSVIGPRSVHLTGYYLGASRQYKLDDESESYGEDIVDTETERSGGAGDDDKYEDSFIDDDEDLQVILPSPSFSDGVNEDLPHGGQKKDAKAKQRRLRKKYQSTNEDASEHKALSNGGLDIMDSECEDMATIRSLVKSCARNTEPGAEEDSEKDGGQTVAKPNRKSHEDCTQPLVENDPKQKKKMNKKVVKEKEAKDDVEDDFFSGEALTWSKSQKNDTKFDHSINDTALINADGKSGGNNKGDNAIHSLHPPDDLINGIVGEKKKKKKKENSEVEVLGADKPFHNAYTENETQPDETRCGKLEQVSLPKIDECEKKANDEVKKAKTGKRKIKQGKEETALEADNSTRGDQSQLDEGSRENIEQGSLLEREDNQKQENDGVKKSKTRKRKHKQGKEEQVLGAETLSRENEAQLDEGSCENIEQSGLLPSEDNQKQANDEGVNMLLSDELVREKVKKPGKRKKKQAKEEKDLEAENTSTHLNGVDLTQHHEAGHENNEIISGGNVLKNVEHQKQSNNVLQRPGVVIGLRAVSEPKKKRKKPAKDKALEADTNSVELLIEKKANGDEQNHKQIIESDVDSNADIPGNGSHKVKKKRKKSEDEEALNMVESMNTTVLDIKENDAKVKPKRVLRAKKKDVKVASP